MVRLFKAFLYKISKDITFRITLIIGAAIAVFMTVLYLALQNLAKDEFGEGVKFLSGQGMLLSSMSPMQNFGIAIPVNLITFTCLEFTQGTIRNKIIAGHSKFKIYASLYLSGLVFTFLLLGTYILICTGLGTIFGGFNLEDMVYTGLLSGQVNAEHIIKMIVICIFTYVSIVSFTIFFATLFRNIGPTIPVVIVGLMMCYLFASIFSVMVVMFEDSETALNVLRIIDPLYAISCTETNDAGVIVMSNATFVAGIANNLVFAIIFFAFGSLIFSKRDVK